MVWDKTHELEVKLRELEWEGRHLKLDDLDKGAEIVQVLSELASTALQEGALYSSLRSFMRLGDVANVRVVGERCLAENWVIDAMTAFEFLGDKEKMAEVLGKAGNERKENLESLMGQYLGQEMLGRIGADFSAFNARRGIGNATYFFLAPILNMASNLADKYDVGIAIARGGLFSAYVFGLYGLDIKVADCHRRGFGATFAWVDEFEKKDLEGKRVAVFDKDVVTGRTVRRVLRELQAHSPGLIDLILVHDAIPKDSYRIGSLVHNVPSGYREIYYPGKFDYTHFDRTVKQLEQVIGDRHGNR